jgi:hypothetical protein
MHLLFGGVSSGEKFEGHRASQDIGEHVIAVFQATATSFDDPRHEFEGFPVR